ncbi:uncharacterized protein TNIN_85771 [Trichonephila inaurata madagascariensis]|uniref:Uncharacterized protein n=1 Tax=Trichonephila inaurata madagascariensis TaxID=2747483 RepID=A0A8X7CEB0_9ARAC|nr:uncharacterized protein TNIN_85771 [Trichonephila inaurata madagascariensis]
MENQSDDQSVIMEEINPPTLTDEQKCTNLQSIVKQIRIFTTRKDHVTQMLDIEKRIPDTTTQTTQKLEAEAASLDKNIESLDELSSDHNTISLHFPRTSKFEIPPPQLNTTFSKILENPENFDLPNGISTHEIESQVSNITNEILSTYANATIPFYHSEQPYVQGELKDLIEECNKARKTRQQFRHP